MKKTNTVSLQPTIGNTLHFATRWKFRGNLAQLPGCRPSSPYPNDAFLMNCLRRSSAINGSRYFPTGTFRRISSVTFSRKITWFCAFCASALLLELTRLCTCHRARDLEDPSKPELDVRVLLVPAGCFLVSMGDPAQHWFAKRLSSELHAKRQPFG